MNKNLNQSNQITYSVEEIELLKKACNGISPVDKDTMDKIKFSNNLHQKDLVAPNRWTPKELDLLEEYYPVGGYDLCKNKGLNRKEIEMKMKYLSIIKNKKSKQK